jgi:hypothetical protein
MTEQQFNLFLEALEALPAAVTAAVAAGIEQAERSREERIRQAEQTRQVDAERLRSDVIKNPSKFFEVRDDGRIYPRPEYSRARDEIARAWFTTGGKSREELTRALRDRMEEATGEPATA